MGEKERSRIRAVQIDNLRSLLGIMRMNEVPNARIRQLREVTKGVDEKIDEGVLQCFGHVERMENDRIAKMVFVGESTSSRPVGRLRKRWIDTVKNCRKKRGLDIRQARKMLNERSVEKGGGV